MATNEGYYQDLGLQFEDLGPASQKLIESWEKFGDDGEPNRSAFSLTNNGKSLYDVLGEDPERAYRFGTAMQYQTTDKQWKLFDIFKAFDWSTLDKPGSRLIDLGGGHGSISQTLAQHTQHMTFTVQDLPHVVEGGRQSLPAELSNRISFEAHDFMQPQTPQEGPPVSYLISRCLHNWSDYYSSQILRGLVPALKSGSQVLIWDSVIEESPIKKLSERWNLQQDIIMATIFSGKDRTAAEFKRLFEVSDERFAIEAIRKPEGSDTSLIQVSWNG